MAAKSRQELESLTNADLMLGYYLLHTSLDGSNSLLPQAATKAASLASHSGLIELYYEATGCEEGIYRWANVSRNERREALICVIGFDNFQKIVKSYYVVDEFTGDTVKFLDDYRVAGEEQRHISGIYAKDVYFPDLNDNARPLGTFDNLAVLVKQLGLVPAQNAMNLELEILKDGRPITSTFEAQRSFLISECLKAGLPKSVIDDHMTALCEQNKYHPIQSYLGDGKWDGIERVNPLIEAMNAKDKSIALVVMKKWFVACVAAIYEPSFSCKVVPVLQSGQSFRKTAFISRFANVLPGAFLEGAELNPDNKDSVLSSIKSWIVELGELERTSKNSQGSLKAFITKAIDSVRPPYARADIKKKRQTTLIASVNGSEFLRDETGSSRYAVIELGQPINMDAVNKLLGWQYNGGRTILSEPENLRQFWLEVKAMYDGGASWELTEAELTLIVGANDQHKFKGDYRVMLEERFLDVDMNGRAYQWMKASEVCLYCDIPATKARVIGKALKGMVQDGLIESKEGRSRIVVYKLPMIIERQ
ncbi:virulence-associated E family protein [Photobacterium sp. J15]|uniref:virulence-associated E family protein n=1 Tax=Photobacterium sp. J15 TaxID=265901 RepID=UPI000ADB759B|nr:virulence-associated E family protein [Photobacterium sp. J15]